ncbi:hypothetical protein GPK27_03200, partial [Catenibacterium mitsuokai]|uniref:D-alanyl-D-alanine carboxypeptidase family protein n=1 Tax=Catenibacterium mitsuokai TaxID=100886 RepID=UPI001C03063B
MENKRKYLFVTVIALFIVSFYTINLRFDPFYRVNGINNDNRMIIEKYLSKEEQKYLVENRIPLYHFMKFIKYDGFYLPNYQYYELLEKTGRYDNIKIILSTGNELAGKLLDSFKNNAYDQAKKLVEHDLESGYLYNQNFDFDKLEIYYQMRPLYDDYSYVDDTEYYIELLKNRGLSDKLIRSFFADACNNYSRYGLTTLMTQANNHEIFLIADPSSLLTTLNDTSYIGAYVPHNLVLMSDIHRLKYAMYLENDAYEALKKMIEAMPDDIAEDFYVKEAYESFNDFQYSNPALAGKDERQLGRTVSIASKSIAYQTFETSALSQWLEAHSYEYGFILRYPKRMASSTNHVYDSHYYRYVGKKT